MIILLLIYLKYLTKISYFQKYFFHAMTALGYLPKWERDLGLAFVAHFLHNFPLFNTTYGQSINVIPLFLLKISNKMCYSFLQTIDDVINFKIYLQSSSKAMADREKNRGGPNTKNWISRERKRAFRWNKKHFS